MDEVDRFLKHSPLPFTHFGLGGEHRQGPSLYSVGPQKVRGGTYTLHLLKFLTNNNIKCNVLNRSLL